jgi:type VI secretion system protein
MTNITEEDRTVGVGFFERLGNNTKSVSLTGVPSAEEVLQSIKHNVSNILNSRVNSSQSAPDLGLVDFNDATLETVDLSVRIKLDIQRCLERYEPRLQDIAVNTEQDIFDPLTLRFHVIASINSEVLHEKIQFNLLLEQNRKYRVF